MSSQCCFSTVKKKNIIDVKIICMSYILRVYDIPSDENKDAKHGNAGAFVE